MSLSDIIRTCACMVWIRAYTVNVPSHICLRILGKCAYNAKATLQTQPRDWHTFLVYQRCSNNEDLVYTIFWFFLLPKSTLREIRSSQTSTGRVQRNNPYARTRSRRYVHAGGNNFRHDRIPFQHDADERHDFLPRNPFKGLFVCLSSTIGSHICRF